jgi:hypothetical protein
MTEKGFAFGMVLPQKRGRMKAAWTNIFTGEELVKGKNVRLCAWREVLRDENLLIVNI